MYDMHCFPRTSVCMCDRLSFLFDTKIGSILEFVIRLGYFKRISCIMAYACIASHVFLTVLMSVRLSAFSFVTNNACTLESFGKLRGVSMNFHTLRYRCSFSRRSMCKKKLERKITNCCSTPVCPFVCLHFRVLKNL